MLNALAKYLRAEIVALYGAVNLIIQALPDLGWHATQGQLRAVSVIANVVLAPVARQLVTPTVPPPVDGGRP